MRQVDGTMTAVRLGPAPRLTWCSLRQTDGKEMQIIGPTRTAGNLTAGPPIMMIGAQTLGNKQTAGPPIMMIGAQTLGNEKTAGPPIAIGAQTGRPGAMMIGAQTSAGQLQIHTAGPPIIGAQIGGPTVGKTTLTVVGADSDTKPLPSAKRRTLQVRLPGVTRKSVSSCHWDCHCRWVVKVFACPQLNNTDWVELQK